MLQRVMIDGIELPRLYIAENRSDAELAMNKGIPFIRWKQGQEALIKILLRPVLEKMFPHIKWHKVLGPRKKFKTEVEIYEKKNKEEIDQIELSEMNLDEKSDEALEAEDWQPKQSDEELEDKIHVEDDVIIEKADASSEERLFYGGEDMVVEKKLSIEDYVGDMNSYVNIEMLQRLRLMPAFIGDILECVKINMSSGLHWSEGYNKRLGLPVGRFNSSGQLPNLVILDVSGSIPRGISATMISLIDTLRTQLSADLIITGSNSRFYPMGSELPSPQRIRNMFGRGNEARDFFGILARDIRGRHYGHVFSFGDNDTPAYYDYEHRICPELPGTTVEYVHHYHTGTYLRYADHRTGYAKWCHMLGKQPREEFDTSWCKVIWDD